MTKTLKVVGAKVFLDRRGYGVAAAVHSETLGDTMVVYELQRRFPTSEAANGIRCLVAISRKINPYLWEVSPRREPTSNWRKSWRSS